MFSEAYQTFLDFIFPKLCLGCGRQGTLLCETCESKIDFITTQICPICHHPSIGGKTHAGCQTPWGIDGLTSIAYFRGPVRNLVHQLKYHGATIVAELIPDLIQKYQQFENLNLPPAIITPVPLHSRSLNARGFNQAAIIAQTISTHTSLPFVKSILKRVTQTPSQTTLTKDQRQQNVRGAFAIATNESIKNASFIIVDDVFTTGATLKEAAKILKRAGAKHVWGFTLAQEA